MASDAPSAADRFNVNVSLSRNYDFLKSRFVGTGNPDTTREEWGVSVARDTLASHVGHVDQMTFFALAANDSVARTRFDVMQRLVQPLPPPPASTAAEGVAEGGKRAKVIIPSAATSSTSASTSTTAVAATKSKR